MLIQMDVSQTSEVPQDKFECLRAMLIQMDVKLA